jgi:predicted transposase/invertase (TIGR01784 family)
MKYVTNAERIGIQKGREQGLEMGKEQKTREIAQEMLRKGMEIEDIADITKLSIEQIQQLQISLSESSEN